LSPGFGGHYWNDPRGVPGGVAGLDFGSQIPKNLFINSTFLVNQRGLAAVTGGANSPNWVCDRWWAVCTGGGNSVNIIPNYTPFGVNNMNLSLSISGNISIRYAGVEAIDASRLINGLATVNISFTKQNFNPTTTLTLQVIMGASGSDQNFTTNGSYAIGNTVLTTVDLANAVQDINSCVKNTFLVPNHVGNINISFRLDFASTTVFPVPNLLVRGISIVQGNVPIPFSVEFFEEELIKCQRYFQRYNFVGDNFFSMGVFQASSATVGQGYLALRPNMRVRPTITIVGTGVSLLSANAGAAYPITAFAYVGGSTTDGQNPLITATAPTGALVAGNATLVFDNGSPTSDVFLDAEL